MFQALLNLFFPPTCASCRKEGDFLCKNCVHNFRLQTLRLRSIYPSSEDFEHLSGVIYGADYTANTELQAAISQFKYKFSYPLVHHFADLTSQKLQELNMLKGRSITLVPVPLHKKQLNYRGFNQAELIASETAERYQGDISVSFLLKRTKNTSQQAKLSKKERHRNLASAFELAGDLSPLSESIVFLVDDVCTTGATLDNCAKVLKDAGLKKVYGLVVARAFK